MLKLHIEALKYILSTTNKTQRGKLIMNDRCCSFKRLSTFSFHSPSPSMRKFFRFPPTSQLDEVGNLIKVLISSARPPRKQVNDLCCHNILRT